MADVAISATPDYQQQRHDAALIREVATSADNTIITTVTKFNSPKFLRRIVVTFHDNADPPVQESATANVQIRKNHSATGFGALVTDVRYDYDLFNDAVTAITWTYTSEPQEPFLAGDQLTIVIAAAGSTVFSSVMVEWSTRG